MRPAMAHPYGEKSDRGTGSRTASRECTTVTRIRTRASASRRTAEGKTPREIRRCLKRYIAREALPAPHPVDESSGEPLTNIEASELAPTITTREWAECLR